MLDKQQAVKILSGQGIIPTQQRVELAQILFARPQHLSADQLMNAARNRHQSTISKATVYNTLNLFSRRGLVREVIVDPGKSFYDSNLTNHAHIYNIESGEISDIALPQEINKLLISALPQTTALLGVEVVVRVRNNN